ncbi:MAG: hypothetical protein ABIG61_08360 [Planctomycetota bacterium]
MKEIMKKVIENPMEAFKNSMFYFIAAPVAGAIWLIWAGSVSLPGANAGWVEEQKQCEKAVAIISEIMELDPARLQQADDQAEEGKFNYASAMDKIAKRCGIPASGYKLVSSDPTKIKSQKIQNATVTLKEVDIETFASFLSKIQLQWVNLQCTQLKLTREQGVNDKWKGILMFRYYY